MRDAKPYEIKKMHYDPNDLSIEKAHELWEKLSDVPTDILGNIEVPFIHFKIGTNRYEIWHWFEETFNVSVIDLDLRAEDRETKNPPITL